MRIISKFSDYYDSALAWGIDTDLVYVRKDDTVILTGTEFEEPIGVLFKKLPFKSRDPCITPMLIGFCGRLHLVYQLEYSGQYRGKALSKTKYLYSVEDFEAAWRYKFLRKLAPNYLTRKSRWRRRGGTRIHRFAASFEEVADSHICDELFHHINSPIFVITKQGMPKIKINCPLKPYGFVRVYDPYMAFQELQMFIGGVLRRAEPIMATISDIHMLKKKGFYEYSFKTRPTESIK